MEIDLNHPPVLDADEGSFAATAATAAPAAIPNSGHVDVVWENPPRKRRTPREDVWAAESSKPNRGGDGGAEGGGKKALLVVLDRKESTGTEEDLIQDKGALTTALGNGPLQLLAPADEIVGAEMGNAPGEEGSEASATATAPPPEVLAADESAAAVGAREAAAAQPGVTLRRSVRLMSQPHRYVDAVLLEPLHSVPQSEPFELLPELRPRRRGPRKSEKRQKKKSV
ncbi:OLC1v1031629C1 [Oldenlandia corymbosa var. corymbosa]|uniref:OLC1v1031629C1 n=1 Tax=Oldenlandia corymbosa var. corymbosa TaxID=529605 RepID=A0AAV1CKV4_OLDCO|nr:OLC1v1031629C1 [Oldenlandia corymbosa var. corymbosa]